MSFFIFSVIITHFVSLQLIYGHLLDLFTLSICIIAFMFLIAYLFILLIFTHSFLIVHYFYPFISCLIHFISIPSVFS